MNELKIKGQWFKVDNVLIDVVGKHIGCIPVAIYLSLKRHANQDNLAWPSYRLIAEELKLSDRTVSRNIECLVKYGLISRVKGRHGGQWANYTYHLRDRDRWYIGVEPHDTSSHGEINNQDEIGYHETESAVPSDFNNNNREAESLIKNTNFIKTKKEDTDFFQGEELTSEERKQKIKEIKKAFYSKIGNRNLS